MYFLYFRLRVHLVSGSVTTRRIRCVSDVAVELIIFKRSDVRSVLTLMQREGTVSLAVMFTILINAHFTCQITGEKKPYEDIPLVRDG